MNIYVVGKNIGETKVILSMDQDLDFAFIFLLNGLDLSLNTNHSKSNGKTNISYVVGVNIREVSR